MTTFKLVAIWLILLSLAVWLFSGLPLQELGTPILLVLPVGGALALWAWIRKPHRSGSVRRQSPRLHPGAPPRESHLDGYSRLIRACLGDVAQAEQLIAVEIRQRPALLRGQAILAALARLETDRAR